jgi:HD-like signal output (HDOD) protein
VGTASTAEFQQQALRSLDLLPPFSPVLNRLLASLADEDVSFLHLASLIETDPVLAGNVLRVVNSAAYGCRGRINSVAHAIAIMGMIKLRNTALGCSVARLWKGVPGSSKWSMADFNLHSTATAILSDQLAQRVGACYPEGAFVAGLFHDLGKLMIAVGLPPEIAVSAQPSEIGDEARERKLLGVSHADLSALALDRWNLPRPVRVAVAFHHDPSASPPDTRDDQLFSLADLVSCADLVVHGDTAALGRLGLEDSTESVMAAFEREFESVKSTF